MDKAWVVETWSDGKWVPLCFNDTREDARRTKRLLENPHGCKYRIRKWQRIEP